MTDIAPSVATSWVARWETQQQRYAQRRDERFAAICAVVDTACRGTEQPTVVDIGCGPGSLAAVLHDRLPDARTVGVDADPFLLALGRAAHPGIRFVDVDWTQPHWVDALQIDGPIDAIVSTTALHYPPEAVVGEIYCAAYDALRDGGLLINADQMPSGHRSIDRLAAAVTASDPEPGSEDWQSWWRDAAAEPAFASLLAQRPTVLTEHGADNDLTVTDHRRLLAAAGFGNIGTVWQNGASTVVAAVR